MARGCYKTSMTIEYDDFLKIDIRVGTVIEVHDFPEARRPAYKLVIDFGADIGVKKSSAQITELYAAEDLVGKQICAVVNFPPKQIWPFISEVLVTGFGDDEGHITLIEPNHKVPNGARLH